jgi:glutathione S-transferase
MPAKQPAFTARPNATEKPWIGGYYATLAHGGPSTSFPETRAQSQSTPKDIPYTKNRHRAETARLYAVIDRKLAQNEFVAGDLILI